MRGMTNIKIFFENYGKMKTKIIFVLVDIKRTRESKGCICNHSKRNFIEYLREANPVFKSKTKFIYNVIFYYQRGRYNQLKTKKFTRYKKLREWESEVQKNQLQEKLGN